MDDIKLYANTLQDLYHLADITQTFSTDIHMEFGVDKCKIQSVKQGMLENNAYQLNNNQLIEPVDDITGYKYLGYYQTQQIQQTETKTNLMNKFKTRIHKILNTDLNSRNIVKAINTYAIPILTFSFGIINWTKTDLRNLQRIINTFLTKYRKHHPKACIQRMTLSKDEGGRGFIDIQNLHSKQITALRKFFHNQAQHSLLHKAVTKADYKYTPLNLHDHTVQSNETITAPQQKIETWEKKALHGRHYADLSNP